MNCLFADSIFSSQSVHNGIFKRRQYHHSNDYGEKGWSVYKIWKDYSSKNWTYVCAKRLLKRFKDRGTMNRKEGSGRPRSVATEENTDLIEELICSQEEALHTHT